MKVTSQLLLGLLVAAAGCGKDDKPQAEPRSVAPDPGAAAKIVIKADSGFIYRYFPEGSRKPETTTKIDDIPLGSRDMVIVIPDEPPPPGLAYVADMTKAGADGTYNYKVVPTTELDRALDQSRGQMPSTPEVASTGAARSSGKAPDKAAKGDSGIIMFSASWCGVCTKARRWFRNKGIQYTERDIEKDSGAQAEMAKLAAQAGVPRSQLTGVPVIWVNGTLFSGFDPRAIESAM